MTKVNTDDVIGRAWSAQGAMLDEAKRLEDAAARLRKRAHELWRVLDPPLTTPEE